MLNRLRSDNPISNVRAIVACVGRSSCTTDEAKAIADLVGKNEIVLGYSIAEYALAALDVLRIRHYNGDNENVRALIAGMPTAVWVQEVTRQVHDNYKGG